MGEIDTIIETEEWARAIENPAALARNCLLAAARNEPALAGSAALLLADDETIRAMNRQFRKIDKPTNVLSFPSGGKAPEFLGDIALGFETCQREAADKGVAVTAHTAHLIVHGLLHLVGYVHEDDSSAEAMEAKEIAILAALGVDDPYGAAYDCEELNN